MSEPRYFGAPGHCYSIDGDWWHDPGACTDNDGWHDQPCCGVEPSSTPTSPAQPVAKGRTGVTS